MPACTGSVAQFMAFVIWFKGVRADPPFAFNSRKNTLPFPSGNVLPRKVLKPERGTALVIPFVPKVCNELKLGGN